MPHTHMVCPDSRNPPIVLVDDCLACAQNPDRGCDYNLPMLRAMVERPDDRLSYTRMDDCQRRVALKRRYPYAVDPKSAWWKLRGLLFHAGLEQLDVGEAVVEVELEREFAGERIQGRFDLAYPQQGLICDWKSASVLPKVAKPNHVGQLSLYAWLARDGEALVEGERKRVQWDLRKGEITYFTMREVRRFLVDLWPEERTLGWLRSRLPLLRAAYDPEAPLAPPLTKTDPNYWLCRDCEVADKCIELERAGQ